MVVKDHIGVVFVAQSPKSIQHLEKAIMISRSHLPKFPIHVVTNDPNFENRNASSIEFSAIISMADRIHKSPFQKTLLLDASKIIVEDLTGLFKVLDRFDIAFPYIQNDTTLFNRVLPQFDTKVILFNKKPELLEIANHLQKAKQKDMSVVFQKLILESTLLFHVLPPEYNIYQKEYLNLWTTEEARPKIIDIDVLNELPRIQIRNEKQSLYQQLRTTKHKINRIWQELKYSV